jgi:hypothetical protein
MVSFIASNSNQLLKVGQPSPCIGCIRGLTFGGLGIVVCLIREKNNKDHPKALDAYANPRGNAPAAIVVDDSREEWTYAVVGN